MATSARLDRAPSLWRLTSCCYRNHTVRSAGRVKGRPERSEYQIQLCGRRLDGRDWVTEPVTPTPLSVWGVGRAPGRRVGLQDPGRADHSGRAEGLWGDPLLTKSDPGQAGGHGVPPRWWHEGLRWLRWAGRFGLVAGYRFQDGLAVVDQQQSAPLCAHAAAQPSLANLDELVGCRGVELSNQFPQRFPLRQRSATPAHVSASSTVNGVDEPGNSSMTGCLILGAMAAGAGRKPARHNDISGSLQMLGTSNRS